MLVSRKHSKLISMVMTLAIVFGTLLSGFAAPKPAVAAPGPGATVVGATYFTDTDNWDGKPAGTLGTPDEDLDLGKLGLGAMGNPFGSGTNLGPINLYPFEFAIEDVGREPQTSAYLLVRGYDVDEEDGEWDRVYMSSDPAEIQLQGSGYNQEFPASALVGALSGTNNDWNTTVFELSSGQINVGQHHYIGITVHNTNGSTSWVADIDWAQIVIDGGVRETGEISHVNVVELQNKSAKVDLGMLPKVPGEDYYVEVSIIDPATGNNLASGQKPVPANDANGPVIIDIGDKDTNLTPGGTYEVQVILFRAVDGEPKEAQHIYVFKTDDPNPRTVNGTSIDGAPVELAAEDFQNQFYLQNGTGNQGTLAEVRFESLPTEGELLLDGNPVAVNQPIPYEQLDNLVYHPAEGQTGPVTFKWNGKEATGDYAPVPGNVDIAINGAPTVKDIVKGPYEEGVTPIEFALADFEGSGDQPKFIDPEGGQLQSITLVSVPSEGHLALESNPEVPLTAGTTISRADLDKLNFYPAEGQTGSVVFAWTGSDGAQDSKNQANVTIDILIGASLELTANPDKIVGDGKSTSELTAVVKDGDGNPVEGVEVVFEAPAGSFVDPKDPSAAPKTMTAKTDADGVAKVIYRSAKMQGIDEQTTTITATVNDPDKGILEKDTIDIVFLPASINGIITVGNEPIAGATVTVWLDRDKDGVRDFEQTVTTDEDGAYSVPVPYGDEVYQLEITREVEVGGVMTPVTFTQKAVVGDTSGGGDNFDSEKTVTGVVLIQQPDGATSLLSGALSANMKAYLKDADGNYILGEDNKPKGFPLGPQGVFSADGLSVGEYELEIRYEFEPGVDIVVSRGNVAVKANGELNIVQELVDPYGTVTDMRTGKPIEGAEVTLYYANTDRNRAKGIATNTKVELPELVGFAPNDNASPVQYSDEHGFYAYMVYPETDYYLIVTKDGYVRYTSPVLSVEWDIVKHDVPLAKRSSGGGAVAPAAEPEVTLNLSVDKNRVEEGGQSTVTVEYKNIGDATAPAGEISIAIPAGAEVVDADGGEVNGNRIVWQIDALEPDEGGSFDVVLKWPMLEQQEDGFNVTGEYTLSGGEENGANADSSVRIQVFSNRFDNLQHQRYILGFPDGDFKPNRSLTRAELAAIVARLTENAAVNEPLSFSDVPAGHWAENYIKIAIKHSYFNGFEDGTFRPDAPVTRGELASVMARFLGLEIGVASDPFFSDVEGHWAADAIEHLYRGKYVTGYPDGTFKPNNDIIRSEAVTLINRMLARGPLTGLAQQFPDMPETHWAFGDVQEATVSHEAVRNADGSETWVGTLPDDVK